MVQAAMRVARAYTARPEVIKFEGHYHGWFDSALVSVAPVVSDPGKAGDLPLYPGSEGQVPSYALKGCTVFQVREQLTNEGKDHACCNSKRRRSKPAFLRVKQTIWALEVCVR